MVLCDGGSSTDVTAVDGLVSLLSSQPWVLKLWNTDLFWWSFCNSTYLRDGSVSSDLSDSSPSCYIAVESRRDSFLQWQRQTRFKESVGAGVGVNIQAYPQFFFSTGIPNHYPGNNIQFSKHYRNDFSKFQECLLGQDQQQLSRTFQEVPEKFDFSTNADDQHFRCISEMFNTIYKHLCKYSDVNKYLILRRLCKFFHNKEYKNKKSHGIYNYCLYFIANNNI